MIVGILIFILVVGFVLVDRWVITRGYNRCPNCKQKVNARFSLQKGQVIKNENGQHVNTKIYKCERCGYGWNHTEIEYESS